MNRCDNRTNVCAISSTATDASRNVSGTARPTTAAVPCGLMLIAIDGAISATDTPTADHTLSVARNSVIDESAFQSPSPTATSGPENIFPGDQGLMVFSPT